MRRRFTSAIALWEARSWRRSSGWATAAAIVPRTRAGEGDKGSGLRCGRRGLRRCCINRGLYQSALMLFGRDGGCQPARRAPSLDSLTDSAQRLAMSAAALDRLLALLIAALVTTGLVTLRMGAEGEAWVFAVHGLLAAALAVTVAMK